MHNIILQNDSYKFGHFHMLPAGTTHVYSYFEARTGAQFNKTVFFGLQYILKRYLEGRRVTPDYIREAEELAKAHFGTTDGLFNRKMWEHIEKKHGGFLPIRIKAVAEGTPVEVNNVLMTVENTDPECAALTNILEDQLSHTWYSSTVATLSREVKQMLKHYLEQTADTLDMLPFQLHDFGLRGATGLEAAGIGGAGHLVNFLGTDTVPAMTIAQKYYGAKLDGLAYSVPASEHSVMTSMGREGEQALLLSLLVKYPTGILSLVIDSYDYKNFITLAAGFKDIINKRSGKVVFRPDSGDPTSTTMDVLEMLGAVFTPTVNTKGYKKLPDTVGVLWGDGLDYQAIRSILFTMRNNGWATDNIVFGMGGGLLQKVNRDTQRFAFKCSAQQRDGVWIDIQKQPLDSSKLSKKGRLQLSLTREGFKTEPENDSAYEDQLTTVFENGELKNEYTFDEVRKNAS